MAKKKPKKLPAAKPPADWDPDPHDRVWVRSAKDGQLGWRVREGGVDKVRLDRPSQRKIVPYHEEEWIEEDELRPMTVAQMAQVAFAADCALRRFLGDHEGSRQEWVGLSDEHRRAWIDVGPQNRLERKLLYTGVMTALRDFAR